MATSIGFTGTRKGMNFNQRNLLRELLEKFVNNHGGAVTFHHGDCIGADEQAHKIAEELKMRIVVHPPEDPKYRAFCQGHEEEKPLPYLERNRNIVSRSYHLIAAPKEQYEVTRSGTWYTVRRAREQDLNVLIIKRGGRYAVGI